MEGESGEQVGGERGTSHSTLTCRTLFLPTAVPVLFIFNLILQKVVDCEVLIA